MIDFGEYPSLTSSSLCFKKRIGKGKEAVVYDNDDGYVYKVLQNPMNLEELQSKIDRYNAIPFSLKLEVVGYVTVIHKRLYVLKQPKIKILEDYIEDIIKNTLKKYGYERVLTREYNDTCIDDLNYRNLGIDESGEIRLIDGGFTHGVY